MSTILYCSNCKRYTLEKKCNVCKKKTINNNPSKFSPQDHYGKYRRKLKKMS